MVIRVMLLGRVDAIGSGYMLMPRMRIVDGWKEVRGRRMIMPVVSEGVGMPWWV
jgi:hypothetical protein